MFTRGMADYVAPAIELLLALEEGGNAQAMPESSGARGASTHPDGDDVSHRAGSVAASPDLENGSSSRGGPHGRGTGLGFRSAGSTLLVYLRCCMRGSQFPPGAEQLPAQTAGVTKAALLGAGPGSRGRDRVQGTGKARERAVSK